MSSRIILILASTFFLLGNSCSMFSSTPDTKETADAAAKKDAENIASDTGLDAAPPADSAAAMDVGAAANEKSLFDRIGGKLVLGKFSAKFIDAMAANPKLLANPKIAVEMKKDQAKHKASMTEYLCQISGGPCKYSGPSMKDAHMASGVSAEDWKLMGGLFIKTLRDMNVGKNERKELANLVSMAKPDVVSQ